MTVEKKIKVAWICHFSNEEIRNQLHFAQWTPTAIFRRFFKKKGYLNDFAIWNTNAIKEFEKFDDIELHIISPHSAISGKVQYFNLQGIHYHFFKSETDRLLTHISMRLGICKLQTSYERNSRTILNLVREINPQIIHLIGAENPHYSESALWLPKEKPLIVSLQTLMSDPDFFKNYPISKADYDYRSSIERQVIKHADYIATKVERFRTLIKEQIDFGAKFLDMSLAVGENINLTPTAKEYDFIYFAADISKAIDHALEAFAIAKRTNPHITLHVVGSYSDSFMLQIEEQMKLLSLGNEVTFTGRLETHDDVLKEIRKARFAILPLKIDILSGTIREAMANGIPTVTTITPATPQLNEKRKSILLSEKGNFEMMAQNMCALLSDEEFANSIKQNAIKTINERYDNHFAMNVWREYYIKIHSGEI